MGPTKPSSSWPKLSEIFRSRSIEPELQLVASWVARGLTAYDAAYVALAEERDLALVTDDETIIELAPEISRPLV